MNKNKYEKPEDFVGWKSDDGMLEVIDIHGKQGTATSFKVICHKCKEDKELFPLGYFVSLRGNLIRGVKPCGCSKIPKWSQEQFLILARRAAQDRFIVRGFAEEFHGVNTKLNIECLIHEHKWVANIHSVINVGSGCPKCSLDARKTDQQEALNRCKTICEIEGYNPLGFIDGYKNCHSRFEYKCPIHGLQSVSYTSFVNTGSRCRGCYKDKQKVNGNGNGYFPERKDEKDFLYVLDFNDKFLKVGRSFDVEIGRASCRERV